MDQDEIKKSIAERFNNLQPEIQDAIMDSDYEKNIYEIAQKHKLSIDQMGEFEADTTLVMLGQIHPDEYNKELMEDLNIPEDKVNEIVNDVNEKILNPIRELLKKNFEDDNKIESELIDTPKPPYKDIEIKKVETPIVEKNPEPVIPNNLIKKDTKNIMEEKLKGVTLSNSVTTDYTAPKINDSPSNTKDPYREVF